MQTRFFAIFLTADARQFLLPFVRTWCFVHAFHVGVFSSMQMGLLKNPPVPAKLIRGLGGFLVGINEPIGEEFRHASHMTTSLS